MSWKVLITATPMERVGGAALARLTAAGCEIVSAPRNALAGNELIGLLAGVDAVIAGAGDHYTNAVLAAPTSSRLKIISRWGVGYDAIDVAAATARGILVAYTPGMTDNAVADYTMALLLALARRIPPGHQSMREGWWLPEWGQDLAGQTLGILGFGRIGRAVARRAQGFDLRLLAHDPKPNQEDVPAGVQFVTFDELLSRSDFLTLHAAAPPRNRGLLGREQFRRMKPTACLINAARGALVDEPALLEALREGWIAGAALDVFDTEPLPPHDPLRTAPNVLLSPHQASATIATGERVSLAAAEAILALRDGRKPEYILNPEVFAGRP